MEVYCDGSCLYNGIKNAEKKSLGIGVHFPYNRKYDLSLGIADKNIEFTNNQAEIVAAIFSLEQALKVINIEPIKYQKVIIYTDSNYVVTAMTKWIFSWRKKNWRKADNQNVINEDGFKYLLEICQKFDEIKIEWKHVEGHNGDTCNSTAHKLAFKASKEALDKIYD